MNADIRHVLMSTSVFPQYESLTSGSTQPDGGEDTQAGDSWLTQACLFLWLTQAGDSWLTQACLFLWLTQACKNINHD